jgi:hypothetical protein
MWLLYLILGIDPVELRDGLSCTVVYVNGKARCVND